MAHALSMCMLIAGCGSSADSTTDPGDDDDDSSGPVVLTPARRVESITAIHDRIGALTGSDADSRRTELLAYLQNRPEFEASGINDDGSLWARFTDERLLLFPIAPYPSAGPATEPGPAFAPAPAGPVARAQSAAPGIPNELPVSNQARVLGGGEPPTHAFFTTTIPRIQSMLTLGGYRLATSAGLGTIDELLAVGGDGFFYFGGHGGSGWTRDLERFYGVTTATPLSVANDTLYRNLWLDTSLVYTVEITSGIRPYQSLVSGPCSSCFFAFTKNFVSKHMGRFSDHSIVYMGACTGADQGFRQAFLSKNVGVYFGWNDTFQGDEDSKTTLRFIDRLLGLNHPAESPPTPPQRAFDYVSVYNNSLPYTRSGRAVLNYYPNASRSGLLAPSIETMYVDEENGLLVLGGKFGSRPGKVFMSGAELGNPSWTADTIRVRIPVSGPLSAGRVHVEIDGRWSNKRLLTDWFHTFNLEFVPGEGSLRWEGEIHLHIRADVASFRREAEQAPVYRTVPFMIARDSWGEISASGSSGTTSWTGTATFKHRLESPGAANTLDAFGEIDTQSPAMRLFLFVSAPDGMSINTQFGPFPLVAVWAYGDAPLSATNPLPALHLLLDRDFGIIGDFRRVVPIGPSSVLFWSSRKPNFFPADSLAR